MESDSIFLNLKATVDMIISTILLPLFKLVNRKRKGRYILQHNWDVLIILDACRCDFFRVIYKRFKLNGRLKCVTSRGSNTKEFLDENFVDLFSDKFKEIVYVSANPFVDLSIKKKVFKVISVWRTDWDYNLGTVPPKAVYKHALKAALKYYPNKRIIVHFIQPHYPFRSLNFKLSALENFANLLKVNRHNWWIYTHMWISAIRDHKVRRKGIKLQKGGPLKIVDNPIYRIERKVLVRAYLDNLLWVMRYVTKLIDILPGKIVVTADHGDSFGERLKNFPIEIYGHPPFLHFDQLIKVPWLEIRGKGNKVAILKELAKLQKR